MITIAGIVWHVLPAILWRLDPRVAKWPLVLIPLFGSAAGAISVLWLTQRWSNARDWSDLHLLAVAAGAVISHTGVGCIILTHTTLDRVGIIALAGVFLLSLRAYVFRRLEQNIPSGIQVPS